MFDGQADTTNAISRLGQPHPQPQFASNPGGMVYLGGGRVPERVRSFIDHIVESLAKLDVFDAIK